MSTIFMNSKNNLTDKKNSKKSDKFVAYQTLVFTIHRKY